MNTDSSNNSLQILHVDMGHKRTVLEAKALGEIMLRLAKQDAALLENQEQTSCSLQSTNSNRRSLIALRLQTCLTMQICFGARNSSSY